jgi:hypothetical protein
MSIFATEPLLAHSNPTTPSKPTCAAAVRQNFGIARAGAIGSPGAADADPMQLAHGLLSVALSRGARLFEPKRSNSIPPRARSACNRSAQCDSRHRPCDAEDHSFDHSNGVVELGDRDRAAAANYGKAGR